MEFQYLVHGFMIHNKLVRKRRYKLKANHFSEIKVWSTVKRTRSNYKWGIFWDTSLAKTQSIRLHLYIGSIVKSDVILSIIMSQWFVYHSCFSSHIDIIVSDCTGRLYKDVSRLSCPMSYRLWSCPHGYSHPWLEGTGYRWTGYLYFIMYD